MKKNRGKTGPASKAAKKAASRNAGALKAAPAQGVTRRYLKSKPVCKVTFRLPATAASGARRVEVLGDFTGWHEQPVEARRLKNGDFTITLDLEKGRAYRFRYLVDGERWENDWCADRYEQNPFGCDDSVIII